MSKLIRMSTILAKAEVSYGTDPTPGDANGILISEPTFNVNGSKVTRDYLRATISPIGHVVGEKSIGIDFETELKGSGTGGTALKAEALLLACGLGVTAVECVPISGGSGTFVVGETVTGGTSSKTGVVQFRTANHIILSASSGSLTSGETITGGTSGATATVGTNPMDQNGLLYKPVSSSFGSCTIYYYLDGIRHIAVGCRGSLSLDFTVGQYPKMSFKMVGQYAAPSDNSVSGTAAFDTGLPPQVLGVDLNIGAFGAAVAEKVSVDLGVKTSLSKNMQDVDGIGEVRISGRDPSGSVDPDVEALSTFNPWTIWDAGTKQAILVDVGSTYGNRVALYMKEAQFDNPKYRNSDGLAKYDIPFIPTGSDDEIKLLIW
jgi:hypothetical protein